MPFGFTNAPATFHATRNDISRLHLHEFVLFFFFFCWRQPSLQQLMVGPSIPFGQGFWHVDTPSVWCQPKKMHFWQKAYRLSWSCYFRGRCGDGSKKLQLSYDGGCLKICSGSTRFSRTYLILSKIMGKFNFSLLCSRRMQPPPANGPLRPTWPLPPCKMLVTVPSSYYAWF